MAHQAGVGFSGGVVAAVKALYEGPRTNVQRLRKLTIWPFVISLVFCCWNECLLVWRAVHIVHFVPLFRIFLVLALFAILAMIYGAASWSLAKGKRSGKVWALIASLTFVLIPLWAISHYPRSVPGSIWVLLAIGMISQIVLLWPDGEAPMEAVESSRAKSK